MSLSMQGVGISHRELADVNKNGVVRLHVIRLNIRLSVTNYYYLNTSHQGVIITGNKMIKLAMS